MFGAAAHVKISKFLKETDYSRLKDFVLFCFVFLSRPSSLHSELVFHRQDVFPIVDGDVKCKSQMSLHIGSAVQPFIISLDKVRELSRQIKLFK